MAQTYRAMLVCDGFQEGLFKRMLTELRDNRTLNYVLIIMGFLNSFFS